MITFHVITLFPQAFKSYLGESIIARAIREKSIAVKFYNPRDFTPDKWARVDRRPYGGGPGMVLEAPAFVKAIEKAIQNSKNKKTLVLIFSAGGKEFTNMQAKKIADQKQHVVLVCGRYEGIDTRVKKIFKAQEISVGPYVLTGGELPAMIVVDAVARQIEGVLGNFDSVEERRVSSSEVYTRPEVFIHKGKKYRVPKILLSGHHAKIDEWKKKRG
ncbi:MAG: tRNA (guanosine(37)-N1)-methyltransferase TrmD [Candidatus Taylorbacteria bacterium RIFCSPHIGHO2_01_FULL_46_22b]|uniref:tRNA (guanine-N(1)-)-methyltransferase n=1 Tax=Candidatus Taylorbacteria bacterium RIFCSPHIGHO2_01_FULL_46_22b TaxID=1802301 RepID=A0A1G2M414_9BACT|nr:MAG: tRNA (guanosine(37)-N1)-methyltransferase TrmD [Candidatus Taylorbacteria bacterium RIFCSPHIGHO2_01_FULL_46_22b]